MNTHRLNITLPKELVRKLENKPNKSAFIAEAVRQKLAEEEDLLLKIELVQAYQESSREADSVAEEWDSIVGDDL